ncbi:hypothetical protein [Sulfuricystis multivorans]|uniref:hypothetical protein n=1 Tax=Sulfuricystis multivorans TaxID=2211108 RepID=UPI0015587D8E|nr:hypothetical protein [Sulfuricystis multivorans]
MSMKRSLRLHVFAALLAGLSLHGHANDDIAWRYQARHGDVVLTANPQAPAPLSAFYAARGFAAEAIRPYANSCGFSFGMRNGGPIPILTRLADWRVADAKGRRIGFRLPESWDADWALAKVPQSARIAFRWAQFQTENSFEPGDWIMGMATLESVPAAPFRLIARYHDNKGDHEIVLDQLECAHD